MFNSNNGFSLSDIAAVTRDNDGNGFGGNNGWWILIILFAIFGGWGNGGWNRGGYGASDGGGVQNNYVLASDFASIERKLDTVNNGLCDGFYAQNTNLLNGFSNTNMAITNGFAGVGNAICSLGYENSNLINGVNMNMMNNTNALTAQNTALANQLQQCCCDNRAATADLKYTMAQQTAEIMANCNNNYRQLHDEMVATQMAAKDAQIAEQAQRINALELKASQEAQTAQLTNTLRPCPSPAYVVPNPYCNCGNAYSYGNSGCNCGGCGC